MKVLITTLASGWYKKLAPIFEYTAKKFNPDCDVKVFFKEDIFPKHADKACGLLRFCVPNKHFKGYDYVYFTDIDFVFLPHKTGILDYHIGIINKTKIPYAGHRGPRKGKFFGKNTRIAGGAFMASQEWLSKTVPHREYYANKFVNGMNYRAQDEVCLQRMTAKAGFPIPELRGRFVNGERFNKVYRNVHLGDFKNGFSHRWTDLQKMKKRFLLEGNIPKYKELLNDERFCELISEAIREPEIAAMFTHLNIHLERRK